MHLLTTGPADATHTIILTHGAGGGMRTPFLEAFAHGLGARGIRVIRFEFPYMAAKRGAPDKQSVLLDTWRAVVGEVGNDVVIGGRSMGGRMASMVADELRVRGLVCLGYPFHPPGKPEQLRTAHLAALRTPALVIQGTRDPFGTREEVAAYALSPSIEIEWLEDGDHGFKPRKASGQTERGHLERAVERTSGFVKTPLRCTS